MGRWGSSIRLDCLRQSTRAFDHCVATVGTGREWFRPRCRRRAHQPRWQRLYQQLELVRWWRRLGQDQLLDVSSGAGCEFCVACVGERWMPSRKLWCAVERNFRDGVKSLTPEETLRKCRNEADFDKQTNNCLN